MVDIEALKAKYFVQTADANLPSQPVPATYEGCKVTPLIDAAVYFDELASLFATLGNGATPADNAGQFIYIANWWFDLFGNGSGVGPLILGPIGVGRPLLDILKEKAAKGVDVRVLGWVSWAVSGSEYALKYGGATIKGIADLNGATIEVHLRLTGGTFDG